MADLDIDYRSPSELLPRKRAYRTHSEKQIALSAKVLSEFGARIPVLIDADNRIVDGELIVLAAKQLRLNRLPVVRIADLDEGELRRLGLLINRLSDMSETDMDQLALELSDLTELLEEPDFGELGFEQAELDRLLGSTELDDRDEAPEGLEPRPDDKIAKVGDLWLLGAHRLYCGDACDPASYDILMDGAKAQLGLSDVPYNVSASSISGLGKHKHGPFVQASGELSEHEFVRFLTVAMRNMRDHSSDGSLQMIFMSWHHLLELLRAGKIVYSELKNIVTWIKRSGGMGALYRSQTEFVAIFKNGSAPHVNNIQLGRFGRNRTNAWQYDGMNSFGEDRDELLALHPTVKPRKMIADAILDVSETGGIVLDPFVGSGTTIVAAEDVGRKCYAMELDPLYVDVTLRRFRKEFGIEPLNAETGETLSEIESDHA